MFVYSGRGVSYITFKSFTWLISPRHCSPFPGRKLCRRPVPKQRRQRRWRQHRRRRLAPQQQWQQLPRQRVQPAAAKRRGGVNPGLMASSRAPLCELPPNAEWSRQNNTVSCENRCVLISQPKHSVQIQCSACRSPSFLSPFNFCKSTGKSTAQHLPTVAARYGYQLLVHIVEYDIYLCFTPRLILCLLPPSCSH